MYYYCIQAAERGGRSEFKSPDRLIKCVQEISLENKNGFLPVMVAFLLWKQYVFRTVYPGWSFCVDVISHLITSPYLGWKWSLGVKSAPLLLSCLLWWLGCVNRLHMSEYFGTPRNKIPILSEPTPFHCCTYTHVCLYFWRSQWPCCPTHNPMSFRPASCSCIS